MLKAETEKLSDSRVALTIEVEPEKVDAALERAYRKIAREVNIPGFRKGKVPRHIIETRFGPEVLYEDALEELIPSAYQQAIDEHNIQAIDQPSVSDVEIAAGTPLRFRAEVDVVPEAKLGEYKGLKAVKEIEQVEDSDIDHMLEHLLDDQAHLVAVDRTDVQEDDYVVIDFEGFIDNEPFQGGAAKDFTLQIGSGQFIPGFEDQLIGAQVDSDVEVVVTFPEDYSAEDLAGKEALFKVRIHSIKVLEVPELDDDFAASVSDVETLEELRDKIREEMEQSARERADRQLRDRVVEMATDASEVDVPEVMVNRELDWTINEFARGLIQQGIDPGRYLQETGKSVDDLKDEFRPSAEKRVKANIVLQTIAKHEGITVTADEIEAHIDNMVDGSANPDEERRKWEDPDQRSAVESGLQIEKTIDFLVAEAEVEEKEIPSQGHGHHHHHDHDEDDEYDDHEEHHDADGDDESTGDEAQAGEGETSA